METKLFEVRDRATCISVMATGFSREDFPENSVEGWIIGRSGFRGSHYVIVTQLDPVKSEYDAFRWPESPRTMRQAHLYIESCWHNLKSGDLIDVEFNLGESSEKKTSEH